MPTMLNKNPYAAYTQSALETEVMVASPHKLILMLFDGAIQAIANARRFLQEKISLKRTHDQQSNCNC